jgi:two-component system cell cycle sensor histidine kinase/response regulator CckA
MLAYSGRGRFVVKVQDLNQVVREVAGLLSASTPKKTRLQFSLRAGLAPVEADEAQLQQVVLNLVTNAADAIGEAEGEIRITTRGLQMDEGYAAGQLTGQGLAPGPYVVLEVSDNGQGMTPEVQARIFDPFFTTKPKGHGLGLSAILGILKGHRAGLKVYSEPGLGTTFQLYFPTTSGHIPGNQDFPVLLEGHGLILLVDDEPDILEVARKALEHFGFEVETASDGLEALEVFSRRPSEFQLALVDLTMPRMNGRECYEALRWMRPELPVVLCSGFSEQESLRDISGDGVAAFIQKPYTLSALQQALGRALRR